MAEVWLADLDILHEQHAHAADALCEEERIRAGRMRSPDQAARWIASRYFLRRVLAAKAVCRPEEVVFSYGPAGKPIPQGPAAALHVSLSHSGKWVAVATDAAGEVGIDIEALRPLPDALSLAETHFSPAESAWLSSRPHREQAFLALWCRKEAILKCAGVGLEQLDRIAAPLVEEMPVASRQADHQGEEVWVQDLHRPALIGSIATRSRPVCVIVNDACAWLPDTGAVSSTFR